MQSGQDVLPYPQQEQVVYANQQPMGIYPGQTNHPTQQTMSVYPGQTTYGGMSVQTQPELAPSDQRNNYPSDQYGPRRSSRLHNRTETSPYKKKKSTTRKVVEGVVIGVAGTAILSQIEKHNAKTQQTKATGTRTGGVNSNNGGKSSGIGVDEVIECSLAAGAVALALYEKNKGKTQGSGSVAPHNAGLGDPSVKTLVEGVLATAAAVALSFHEKDKQSIENGHSTL